MRLAEVGGLVGGKYLVEEVIGEGGFSVVYRATDTTVGRTVALKVLKPGSEGFDLALAARFTREARILAGLKDAHTLRMFDFGSDDGLLFMVFEFLQGEDLEARIARQLLTVGEAIHVLQQVLISLREAHGAGLLHRDIKPSNIFLFRHLDEALRVKVIDFGIARSVAPDAVALTQTGAVIGTPRYMAPEQAYGEPMPESDLYSLGLVMCEALTGDVREARELVMRSRSLQLPNVPPWLSAILTKMCQGDPSSRFQSADEVLQALADGPQTTSRSGMGPVRPAAARSGPTPSVQAPPPRPSNRRAVVLGVAGVVMVVASVVLWFSSRQQEPPRRSSIAPAVRASTPHALLRRPDVSVGEASDAGAADDADDGSLARPPSACSVAPIAGDSRVGPAHLHVPNGAAPGERLPLLLVFHADGSDALDFLMITKLREFAADEQFAILAFDSPRMGAWRDGVDPQPFFDIVEDARSQACIDLEQVFVLGHGSGGGAAEALSCAPWVRAVATTAYRLVSKPICGNGRPVPALHIAPTKTKNMPVEGGPTCAGMSSVLSLADHEEIWRSRNGCRDRRRPILRDDGTVCYEWAECRARFMSCHVDGGHGWPGEGPRWIDMLNCDGPPPTFDYLRTVWNFFEKSVDE